MLTEMVGIFFAAACKYSMRSQGGQWHVLFSLSRNLFVLYAKQVLANAVMGWNSMSWTMGWKRWGCPTEWLRPTTVYTSIAANHDTPSVGTANFRYETTRQSHGLFKPRQFMGRFRDQFLKSVSIWVFRTLHTRTSITIKSWLWSSRVARGLCVHAIGLTPEFFNCAWQ